MGRAYVDRLKQVEQLREALKPVVCKTLADVSAALDRFPVRMTKSTPVLTDIVWKDEDNQSRTDKILGESRSVSLYQLLIEGMDVVKKRLAVTEEIQKALKAAEEVDDNDLKSAINMRSWDVDNLRFAVDVLIEKRLGGKRRGLRVRWKVQEGTYEYDPYSRKMFEITE
jgi:hypothetical protein